MTIAEVRQRRPTDRISLKLDPGESPLAWFEDLVQSVKKRNRDVVTQLLVGAVLERKIMSKEGLKPGTPAANSVPGQGFVVGDVVFHVAVVPNKSVINKCEESLQHNRHPVLLLPRNMIERGKGLASTILDLERRMSFLTIEDFLVSNVITMAQEEGSSYFEVWQSVLRLYDGRVARSNSVGAPKFDLETLGERDDNGN